MARKPSAATLRKMTRESLENALSANKMSEKFLSDKIDEYMSFYDDLIFINSRLKEIKSDESRSLKAYTDATAEKRRISSEMRNILSFLGLQPMNVDLKAGEQDEEL